MIQLTTQQLVKSVRDFVEEADEAELFSLADMILDRWVVKSHVNVVAITKKLVQKVAKDHGLTVMQVLT